MQIDAHFTAYRRLWCGFIGILILWPGWIFGGFRSFRQAWPAYAI